MLPEPSQPTGGSTRLDPYRAAREDLAVLTTFAELMLEGLAGPVDAAQRAHLEQILARADALEAEAFPGPSDTPAPD